MHAGSAPSRWPAEGLSEMVLLTELLTLTDNRHVVPMHGMLAIAMAPPPGSLPNRIFMVVESAALVVFQTTYHQPLLGGENGRGRATGGIG